MMIPRTPPGKSRSLNASQNQDTSLSFSFFSNANSPCTSPATTASLAFSSASVSSNSPVNTLGQRHLNMKPSPGIFVPSLHLKNLRKKILSAEIHELLKSTISIKQESLSKLMEIQNFQKGTHFLISEDPSLLSQEKTELMDAKAREIEKTKERIHSITVEINLLEDELAGEIELKSERRFTY